MTVEPRGLFVQRGDFAPAQGHRSGLVGCGAVVRAMAGDRAVALAVAGGDIFEPAIGGFSRVVAVEIDEALIVRNAVGVMAGGAGGLLVHDVFAVEGKTLVGEDTVPVVALVAEVVGGGRLSGEIGGDELTLQDGGECGSMGTVGTSRTCVRDRKSTRLNSSH